MSEFSAPWWLRNPHAQTCWGRLTRSRKLVDFRREHLEMPDGDELILDHLDQPSAGTHFILMHGLEGSSYSVYMQGLLSVIARHGHSATAINFRSCARDPLRIGRDIPNRRPRFYHSGETTDFDFVSRTLAARMPHLPIVAFGASLGGNVLLKWLGEHPDQQHIAAAGSMSVPYDLGAGSAWLERGAGRFYVASFLRTLKRKVRHLLQHFPETRTILDPEQIARARTFREFDDAATGPLHGFTGADDYYNRASSIHFLERIATPTLCVSAVDDPFLPPAALERARSLASASVEFHTTTSGGHVGFVTGAAPWRCTYWAEELMVQWLVDQTRATASAIA